METRKVEKVTNWNRPLTEKTRGTKKSRHKSRPVLLLVDLNHVGKYKSPDLPYDKIKSHSIIIGY
jgi:hypothetical protein